MNSKGIQPYIYTYPFSSKPHSRPGWYITLSRVLCTIQQVLLGYPFWIWQWVCDLPNIVILILKTQKEGEGLFFSYLITIITIIRLHSAACGILLPWPGIKPMPPALSVQSLNHWITREVPGRVFKDWQHWLCPDLDVLYFTSHLILIRVYFPTFQIQSWGWEKWSLLDKITHLQKFQSQDLNPGLTLKPMVLTRVFSCLTEGNELDLTYRSGTKWKGDKEKWKPTVWGFMLWLEYVGSRYTERQHSIGRLTEFPDRTLTEEDWIGIRKGT